MIKFIKEKIKKHKIKELQTRQKIIYFAKFEEFLPEDIITNSILVNMFELNVEIINENSIIINFILDDLNYKLFINNYDESIVYFKNLLESFIYLTGIDFYYVSATNDPTQAIEFSYLIEENLIGILFCSTDNKEEVDSFAKIIPMERFNQELYKLYNYEPIKLLLKI